MGKGRREREKMRGKGREDERDERRKEDGA